MEQAAAGASSAIVLHMNANAARCLWTGIVVSYARPFADGPFGGFDRKKYAPADPDTRALHDDLLRLRNEAFAHNDDSGMREIVEVGKEFGLPWVMHVESHRPIEDDQWMRVVALATDQARRFRAEGDEIVARLHRKPAGH